jgi:hypothetical protein
VIEYMTLFDLRDISVDCYHFSTLTLLLLHTSLKVLCVGVQRKIGRAIYRRTDKTKMGRRMYFLIGDN